MAVEATAKTNTGKAVFFDAHGNFMAAVTVGARPYMVTFTPDGKVVLVANEGEPNSSKPQNDSVDPGGKRQHPHQAPEQREEPARRGRSPTADFHGY